eukprot:1562683-Pyramimonas_sp.AAC.1
MASKPDISIRQSGQAAAANDCGDAIAAKKVPAPTQSSLRSREEFVSMGDVHVALLARVLADLDGLEVRE